MRAVRADGKQELKQDLVRDDAFGVGRAAELTADLAEFTRPIRQQERLALVFQRGIGGALRVVKPGASEPSSRELVFRAAVGPERRRVGDGLLPVAPEE